MMPQFKRRLFVLYFTFFPKRARSLKIHLEVRHRTEQVQSDQVVFEDGACGWKQHVTCTHIRRSQDAAAQWWLMFMYIYPEDRLWRRKSLVSCSRNINVTHLSTSVRCNYKDVFLGCACICIYEAVCGQVNPIQSFPVLYIWCMNS